MHPVTDLTSGGYAMTIESIKKASRAVFVPRV